MLNYRPSNNVHWLQARAQVGRHAIATVQSSEIVLHLFGSDSWRLGVFDLRFFHLFGCIGNGVFLLLALALSVDFDVGADVFLSDLLRLQLNAAPVFCRG